MNNNKVKYHTRLIPRSHLNLNSQTAHTVIKNSLCDTAEPPVATVLGEYGIDIVETRLVWWELEKEKGCFDFSRLEDEIKKIKAANMKVGLFPWFQHPPKWVLEDESYTKLKCLNHGTQSTIVSLWDEKLLKEYDRLYKVVAEKLSGQLDFLYIGVYGDFGELFFPNGVEHYLFSPPGNHGCLWCGDRKARESFATFLREKYSTVEKLNKAWKTKGIDFCDAMHIDESDSFVKKHDFAVWYTESLMDFADKVCAIARKYFPDIPAGLPIGHMYEPVNIGQIKSKAAKLAAKYNLTARWTGWANLGEFEMSNICARRIASPAKFYGAEFGVEAALFLSKEVAIHAMFEAISSSAQLIHNDPGNIVRGMETYKLFKDIRETKPYISKTAVFYPLEGEMCKVVNIQDYFKKIAPLRRICDYEIVDSYMISDGFLDGIDTLIFDENTPILSEMERIISDYVKNKGLKLLCLGSSMPYVADEDEKRTLGCEIFNEEIPQKDICYTTQFEDFSMVFDLNEAKINKI